MPESSGHAFPLLTRKDGIRFVRDELGFPLSASLLDKKCMRGEGPDIAGYWGKREMYTRQKLREWALKFIHETASSPRFHLTRAINRSGFRKSEMTKSKSPGAVAALGASEIDQLGSRVDPQNRPISLPTQDLRATFGDRTPIEILGHGFRWPTMAKPDIATIVHKVIECELGGAAP